MTTRSTVPVTLPPTIHLTGELALGFSRRCSACATVDTISLALGNRAIVSACCMYSVALLIVVVFARDEIVSCRKEQKL